MIIDGGPSGKPDCIGSFGQTTVTITIAAPGVISWTAHGCKAGDAFILTTTGALPTGLTAGTIYYISVTGLTVDAFSVSTTQANALAGTNITTSGSQSGVQSITCCYSSTYVPTAGRGFNVSLRGTFVASAQLERCFDGGTNWHPLTVGATQLYIWTAPCSDSCEENQYGVQYRMNCTAYTSGTVNYRISQ